MTVFQEASVPPSVVFAALFTGIGWLSEDWKAWAYVLVAVALLGWVMCVVRGDRIYKEARRAREAVERGTT